MGVLYSPLLFVTSFIEANHARRIQLNRRLGEAEDDQTDEWEEAAMLVDEHSIVTADWDQKVQETKPNVEVEPCVLEVRELKKQIEELREMVKTLVEQRNRAGGSRGGRAEGGQVNGDGGDSGAEELS